MTTFRKSVPLLLGSLIALAALPAYAATITLTPSTVSVTPGQTFTVAINVDAGTDKLVTVKSEVVYPQNLVEPVSFTLGTSWTALTQPGYDQMSGGTVIKTGGYAGGFTGSQLFGTLTFKAIAAGTATLATDSSVAYNASGKTTVTTSGSSVTIASAAPTPTPAPAPKPAPKPKSQTSSAASAVKSSPDTASTTVTPSATTTATTTAAAASTTDLATNAAPVQQTAAATASGSWSSWIWYLVIAVLVILLLAWWLRSRRR